MLSDRSPWTIPSRAENRDVAKQRGRRLIRVNAKVRRQVCLFFLLLPSPSLFLPAIFLTACSFPRRSSIERTKPPRRCDARTNEREKEREREKDRFTAGSDRRPSHDFWFAGGRLESFGISIDSTGHRERGSLCGNILPPGLPSKRFCQVLMHRLNSLASCLPACELFASLLRSTAWFLNEDSPWCSAIMI